MTFASHSIQHYLTLHAYRVVSNTVLLNNQGVYQYYSILQSILSNTEFNVPYWVILFSRLPNIIMITSAWATCSVPVTVRRRVASLRKLVAAFQL